MSPVDIKGPDPVRRMFSHSAETRLTVAQRLLRPPALGDVLARTIKTMHISLRSSPHIVRLDHNRGIGAQESGAAVFRDNAQLTLTGLTGWRLMTLR